VGHKPVTSVLLGGDDHEALMLNWRTRERQWELEELDREKQLELEQERASRFAQQQREKARREKEKTLKEIEASLQHPQQLPPNHEQPTLPNTSAQTSMQANESKQPQQKQPGKSDKQMYNMRNGGRPGGNPHHHRMHHHNDPMLSPIPDVPSADERSDHDTPKRLAAKDLLTKTTASNNGSHPLLANNSSRHQTNAVSANIRLGPDDDAQTLAVEQKQAESITGMLNNFSKALGDIRDIREKRMKSEFSHACFVSPLSFLRLLLPLRTSSRPLSVMAVGAVTSDNFHSCFM